MEGKKERRKEYGEAALALHREIKNTIVKMFNESEGVPCVLVSAVEKEVKKDPRTVRFHLKLLEEDGYGKFSKDGKLFCPKKEEKI